MKTKQKNGCYWVAVAVLGLMCFSFWLMYRQPLPPEVFTADLRPPPLSPARHIELLRMLPALAQVESGPNAVAVGADGERGLFQFTEEAWADTSATLRLHGMLGCPSWDCAFKTCCATRYAIARLKFLDSHLATAQGQQPTPEQLYALWNLGLEGFRRRGFLLSNCPPATQDAAVRFLNLYWEGLK